jgi:3-hydroxyphenylacetate 6-hydroxylase
VCVRNLANYSFLLAILIGIAIAVVISWRWNTNSAKSRLKGFARPPGLPIIGHIFTPRICPAEKLRKWSLKYGSVYQIQVGGQHVLVVNNASAAKIMLEQNSSATKSRPTGWTYHKVRPILPFCN